MLSPFLTIPRACSIIWPGSQQTMGELLDQNKLMCQMPLRKMPFYYLVSF